MDAPLVICTLGALAQEHRLAVFRLLVRAGPEGLAAEAADHAAMNGLLAYLLENCCARPQCAPDAPNTTANTEERNVA
jgi:ArsR family transcriptional regulator, arsenate/arsenite/antimonite-responsive transcriptional repressor